MGTLSVQGPPSQLVSEWTLLEVDALTCLLRGFQSGSFRESQSYLAFLFSVPRFLLVT